MRSRRRARCCRPANTTTPGTCRSRTRSCSGSRRAARARSHIVAGGNIEHHPAQHHRSLDRGRRRARQHQEQASVLQRPGGAPGARRCWSTASSVQKFIYGRTGIATANFVNNPERSARTNTKWEFNIDKANAAARRGRLEEGRRRHPRKGRQEAEVRLPDLDQHAAPEEAGDRQAGLPEGRHRRRAEVGDGLGVLLVRRRQPGHLPAFLRRPADVHDDHDAARSASVHGPVRVMRRSRSKANKWQGRNITRWHNAEYDELVPRPASRTRSGQARGVSSR